MKDIDCKECRKKHVAAPLRLMTTILVLFVKIIKP